ncbi:MAG: spoIIIJ-associated protein, partial [Nocardioidaceae bacterium]|nr:spoIIIJ-associated protein [Nocardioidaceae bacterium]
MTEPTMSETGAGNDDGVAVETPSADLSAAELSPEGTSAVETPPVDGLDGAQGAGDGPESAEDEALEDGPESDGSESEDDADSSDGPEAEGGAGAEPDVDRLEREGDIAADYLEELLDIADLDGDLDMDVEGDRAAVSIIGGDVRVLVGRNGEVLEALQELSRLAVYRETGERSRLMLDVGGFRADKRSRLEKVAAEAIAEVQRSGERRALDPMTPFERKVVHDAVAAAGLSSASEGV